MAFIEGKECPHYRRPMYMVYTDESGIEHDVEGSSMCDLVDKPCLIEYGDKCDTYMEWLKEEEDD